MAFSKLKAKLVQDNREEEETSEWILTQKEATYLCSNIRELVASPASVKYLNVSSEEKKYIDRLKQDLKGRRIGSQTFSSGLRLVLLEACRYGSMKVIRFLFKHRKCFDIDALIPHQSHFSTSFVDVHQETTLVHAAARADRVNVLEFLVCQGASVNVRDCGSLTPLITALKRGSSRAAMFLVSAGADIRCANPFGQTSLMYALYCHSTDVLSALLMAGADPTECDHRGYNSLHYAVLKFNSSQVEFLLNVPDILSASSATGPDVLMLASVQENQSSSAAKTLEVLRRNPEYSQSMIVDSFLLHSTTMFLQCLKAVVVSSIAHRNATFQECVDSYTSSLSMKSSTTGMARPFDPRSSTIHSEIETVEEFNSRIKAEDQKFVLAYQCIAIRERCLLNTVDEAIIDSLFTVGMLLLGLNYNVMHGLSMWTRGSSSMLLGMFRQHSTDVSMLSMLHRLLSAAVEYTLRVTYIYGGGDHKMEQPRGFSIADLSPEDRQNVYLPILENLIECLHLEIELDNRRHTHDRSNHDGCSKVLLGILKALNNLQTNKVDNVERLAAEVITKCPWFYHTGWPQSVLHLAVTRLSDHPQFIVMLLENGGKALVNEPGHRGLSPLAQAIEMDSELVPILFEYGAHMDRVDANGDTSVAALNKGHFIDLPLPLTCLAASATVRESIPYKDLGIAPRLKTLVAHHDKLKVRQRIELRIRLMSSIS